MKRGNLRLIGVASGIGAQDPGCEKGPWALKHSHWMHRLAEVTEWSDLIYPHDGLERWTRLADLAQRVGHEVERTLFDGDFPVVVGGDHSCAMGTWSGVARALAGRGPLGLLWIDAHMDSHIPETSASHAVHGMPLAALLGRGQPGLVALAGKQPVVQPEHVCLLAVRSYEEDESVLLDRLQVRVISQAEVQERGLRATLAEALARVTVGTAGFGISFDLDAIDPGEAPGVGSPEPAGLPAHEFLAALTPLLADPRLVALEIAEYNPEHDRAQATLQLIVEVLDRLAKGRGGHG
ncbi:MAG: arginase [Gallionellaceae bacterium]|nr:arginase [Gallionellaceae bacterium]